MPSDWVQSLINGFLLATGSQSPHAINTMNALQSIFSSMWDLGRAIFGVFIDFSNILNLLNSFLPGAWLDVLLIGLGIIVSLRVYSFISDMSLFGFKI